MGLLSFRGKREPWSREGWRASLALFSLFLLGRVPHLVRCQSEVRDKHDFQASLTYRVFLTLPGGRRSQCCSSSWCLKAQRQTKARQSTRKSPKEPEPRRARPLPSTETDCGSPSHVSQQGDRCMFFEGRPSFPSNRYTGMTLEFGN